MAAANILKEKRPTIFWTSCAAHTLDLMLEGICKTPKFKAVIEKAKALTIFIYAHHKTLSLMRKFTMKKDIVRPGVTRFASSFLTLQSLMEKKDKLRLMFSSDEWAQCKWSKNAKGKVAAATVLSLSFWNGVSLVLNVFAPLVKVLRLVDGDRKPSMGFLVGELEDAKKEIMEAYKHNETQYKPIIDIIDTKGKNRLDSPLHLAGYFLNPYYFFKNNEVEDDGRVMDAIITCVEYFFSDFVTQDKVSNEELLKYKNAYESFGRKMTIAGRTKLDEKFDPVGWWSNYGGDTPNLQRMAKRILSLTTSSSGCERNWSTFEGVHTKKRNRLDATRLNNLVYVQFNARLLNKKKWRKDQEGDVLLAREASKAQGWLVKGGDDEEDEEVITRPELSGGMGGEAIEADQVFGPQKSSKVDNSSRNIRELDDEDLFDSDEETYEDCDEEIIFDDSDEDGAEKP